MIAPPLTTAPIRSLRMCGLSAPSQSRSEVWWSAIRNRPPPAAAKSRIRQRLGQRERGVRLRQHEDVVVRQVLRVPPVTERDAALGRQALDGEPRLDQVHTERGNPTGPVRLVRGRTDPGRRRRGKTLRVRLILEVGWAAGKVRLLEIERVGVDDPVRIARVLAVRRVEQDGALAGEGRQQPGNPQASRPVFSVSNASHGNIRRIVC